MSWEITVLEGVVHVSPADDLREHSRSTDCWCHPSPDDECENMCIHHSADRREDYEIDAAHPKKMH